MKNRPTPDQTKQIIEAFEMGLQIKTKQPKEGKPQTEAPLFGQVNAKQPKLF